MKRLLVTGFLFIALAPLSATSQEHYLLDRQNSTARFSIESQFATLAGNLNEFEATLTGSGGSRLRFRIEASADLRSLKLESTEQFAGLNAPLMQSIANPQIRLSGDLIKSPGGEQCVFEGTVKRGKHSERMRLPCKCRVSARDAIVVDTRIARDLSEIAADLPFQFPLGEGQGVLVTRFSFRARPRSRG